jgi:hypothetical protein
MTSRDPSYITPGLKAKLRRKNRLMRAGRTEEAGALAKQIGKEISRRSKTKLRMVDGRTDAKEMWSVVRQLTGRRKEVGDIAGISAESLNSYYADMSTDNCYQPPLNKHSVSICNDQEQYITDWQVFRILDKLRPTATGLDLLPAWFLRLGAPFFCKPLSCLFNKSLSTSTVPTQWKKAWIQPVPKTSSPKEHADFRPISVTPVLTRIMERTIVTSFIYPALLSPAATDLQFADQFAFRPTGSTTAALVSMLHKITHHLVTEPFVIVLALDFSKAFDTVRHSTLMEKLAQLGIPDHVYNWLADFFTNHSHCVKYRSDVSTLLEITASIIQGSVVGPASYVVNAADLKAVTPGNGMCKYADDTYLIIPASQADSRVAELDNVETWSRLNNLRLNRSKSVEIIFINSKRKCKSKFQSPPLINGISRVTSLKILGVTITSSLSASEHVRQVLQSSAQTLYALRILRSQGMNNTDLQTVYRSVVVSKLLYASSAWIGFTTAADRLRIEAFLRRSKRNGFCGANLPSFEELSKLADQKLFDKLLGNNNHVLSNLLPSQSAASQNYSLRPRVHNRELPLYLTRLVNNNFLNRMLFQDSY